MHYNYFRDYDPATGRYIESDLIGLGGGLNTYLYSAANPLMYVDPKGLHYLPDGFGGYVPHTHSYPAPCASCNVDRQPQDDGMLDPYSQDHYRLPPCTACSEEFLVCIGGPDLYACGRCIASRGSDKAACFSCTGSIMEGAKCYFRYCEEGRRGVDGKCRECMK